MKKIFALILACLFVFAAAIPCAALERSRSAANNAIGSYPQSRVTDISEILALNAALSQNAEWSRMATANGTRAAYADVTCRDGKFRAVQTAAGQIYWFRFEPLTWTTVNTYDGAQLLVCNTLVETVSYTGNPNASRNLDYLTETFGLTAFSGREQGRIADLSSYFRTDRGRYVCSLDGTTPAAPSDYASFFTARDTQYLRPAIVWLTNAQAVDAAGRPGWLINLLRAIFS